MGQRAMLDGGRGGGQGGALKDAANHRPVNMVVGGAGARANILAKSGLGGLAGVRK
jgi:hypothetical protein